MLAYVMFKGRVSCGAACRPHRVKCPLEKEMTNMPLILGEGGVSGSGSPRDRAGQGGGEGGQRNHLQSTFSGASFFGSEDISKA